MDGTDGMDGMGGMDGMDGEDGDGFGDAMGYEEPDDDPVLGRQFWALLGGRWRKVTGLVSEGRTTTVVDRTGRRHSVLTARLRSGPPAAAAQDSAAVSEDSEHSRATSASAVDLGTAGSQRSGRSSSARLTPSAAASAQGRASPLSVVAAGSGSAEPRWRGGTPPHPPSFDGEAKTFNAFKVYKAEVKVWQRLVAPYMPPEEHGLRLWSALQGRAKRMLLEVDTEIFSVSNGVEVLLNTIKSLFADNDMVELGTTMDDFFDNCKRKQGETLREFAHRFEITYGKLLEQGESLSERARVNRFLKGSGLSEREQRELLMSIGGTYDWNRIKTAIAVYSSYFQGYRTNVGNAPPSKGYFRGKGSYSHSGGFGKGKGKGYQYSVNELAVADDNEAEYDGDYHVHEAAIEEGPTNDYQADEQQVQLDDGYDAPAELDQEMHEANVILKEGQRRLRRAQQAREVLRARTPASDEQRRQRLQEVKKRTKCAACGKQGHWHGDPECEAKAKGKGKAGKSGFSGKGAGKPGKGQASSVNATAWEHTEADAAETELPSPTTSGWYNGGSLGSMPVRVSEVNVLVSHGTRANSLQHDEEHVHDEAHEMNGAHDLTEQYHMDGMPEWHCARVEHDTIEDTIGYMVLDAACARTVASSAWLRGTAKLLQSHHGIPAVVSDEHELFRFGNGSPQSSSSRWRLVTGIAGAVVEIRSSSLHGSFPLLASLELQKSLGTVIDVGRSVVRFESLGAEVRCMRTKQGHFAVSLMDFGSCHAMPEQVYTAVDDGRDRAVVFTGTIDSSAAPQTADFSAFPASVHQGPGAGWQPSHCYQSGTGSSLLQAAHGRALPPGEGRHPQEVEGHRPLRPGGGGSGGPVMDQGAGVRGGEHQHRPEVHARLADQAAGLGAGQQQGCHGGDAPHRHAGAGQGEGEGNLHAPLLQGLGQPARQLPQVRHVWHQVEEAQGSTYGPLGGVRDRQEGIQQSLPGIIVYRPRAECADHREQVPALHLAHAGQVQPEERLDVQELLSVSPVQGHAAAHGDSPRRRPDDLCRGAGPGHGLQGGQQPAPQDQSQGGRAVPGADGVHQGPCGGRHGGGCQGSSDSSAHCPGGRLGPSGSSSGGVGAAAEAGQHPALHHPERPGGLGGRERVADPQRRGGDGLFMNPKPLKQGTRMQLLHEVQEVAKLLDVEKETRDVFASSYVPRHRPREADLVCWLSQAVLAGV